MKITQCLAFLAMAILAAPNQGTAAITGQWDFNNGDLSATIGQDMEFLDGPGGETDLGTEFGSASSFGLPGMGNDGPPIEITRHELTPGGLEIAWTGGIGPFAVQQKSDLGSAAWTDAATTNERNFVVDADGGQGFFRVTGQAGGGSEDPMVMKFPKTSADNSFGGFEVPDGAFPNNNGFFVNHYTVIMDILFPESSSGKKRALIQTDVVGDTDIFINQNNGLGAQGFFGTIQPNTWHRIAMVVNQAEGNIAYFVDGEKVGVDGSLGELDGRFAVDSYFWLFNDDDGETEEGYLSSLQFRDELLSDGFISALGGPTAGGILTGNPPNPFIASISPSPSTARFPGRSTVGSLPEIRIEIQDGETTVNANSIMMTLGEVGGDGAVSPASVTPQVSKSGSLTTVSYTPSDPLAPVTVYQVELSFSDNATPPNSLGTVFRFGVGPFETIDAEIAGDFSDASNPGFVIRSVQGPVDIILPQLASRAIYQLNGTLTNPSDSSETIENEAIPGPIANGGYSWTLPVNFEKDGNFVGNFSSDNLFPGIPGVNGHTDQFTTEIVTYLQLEAGIHTFGAQVWIERTDLGGGGDDDGFVIFTGANPKDVFSQVIHTFERSPEAPAFGSEPNDNQFRFVAPVAGLYPFRLVYFQKSLGASLEWYSVDEETSEKILINDAVDLRAIKAFQESGSEIHNRAFVAEVRPSPNAQGVSANEPVIILLDDDETSVDVASIQLTLNGESVKGSAEIEKAGTRTRIEFQPDPTRQDELNALALSFTDDQGNENERSWEYTIVVQSGGPNTTATGLWNFHEGLRADIGADLEFFGGEGSPAEQNTVFANTDDLEIEGINGESADVMVVPYIRSPDLGYIMRHGISPNGGGTLVNQYTLIYDVYIATIGDGAASMIQIDSLTNGNDGDYFWQGNNFGQGGGGYVGLGMFTPGSWHRVSLAVDLAADTPVVTKYVDGIKQHDWTQNSLDQPRRALHEFAILFGDNGDEHRMWYVNSIQIREGKLTDAQLAWLGGPSTDGIPVDIPNSTVTGQWDFAQGLNASVGAALEFFGGEGSPAEQSTIFANTNDLEIEGINGESADVMVVPYIRSPDLGYIMRHGISPNGGGTLVNQYTLIYDVYLATTGDGAASMIQIDSLTNGNDGDYFWQGNNFGQGGGGYVGLGMFTPGSWHRVSLAVDLAADTPVVTKYVDGIKQHDWTQNSLDQPRRALHEFAILFGDNGDEHRMWYVNSIQIREGKLTDAQLAWLGGPSADGIPIAIPETAVTGQWDFSQELNPTVGAALEYFGGEGSPAEQNTVFANTDDLEIEGINGESADVMVVPYIRSPDLGYIMRHGISPNGGGTLVNQYTLIYDVYLATTGDGAASMIQIDSLTNGNDGDYFWQGNNFGQGGGGYVGLDMFTPGEWHRVSLAVDLAADTPLVTKFVDGVKQDDWAQNSLDQPRRALHEFSILFADNGDEHRMWYVNSIQIREGKLSDEDLIRLGGPSAKGIPIR